MGSNAAARVLGVSARRIRQMASDGRLDVVNRQPLQVTTASVLAERDARSAQRESVEQPERETLRLWAAEIVREVIAAEIPRQLDSADAHAQQAADRAAAERERESLAERLAASERERESLAERLAASERERESLAERLAAVERETAAELAALRTYLGERRHGRALRRAGVSAAQAVER